VGRALQVLAVFSQESPAMTLSDIAERSGIPVATVHRFLHELEQWGAVSRDSAGIYRVGLRLWEIGMLCPRTEGLREIALPYLEDLAQLTRENVQLAVREESKVVFVERIAGSSAVPVLTKVGANFPPTTTSAGLVLLAHAPRSVVEEILTEPIERFTDLTVVDPTKVRSELVAIRTQGFCISDRQISMETLSVAAPITNRAGQVIAAMSLVVASAGASAHSLVPLVRTSARAISRALATQR
jgi:DNA-binding IclR family transcriptional regulator